MMFWNIEVERKRKRMARQAMANMLGVSLSTYRSWYKTGRIPAAKLKQLAGFFGCAAEYLMEPYPEKPDPKALEAEISKCKAAWPTLPNHEDAPRLPQ